MFYDFGVPGPCRGKSFVVTRRPNNACDANFLDVTLVRGSTKASMAARLSPMTRYLRGSQPHNSLLHLDYAILVSSMLDHTRAFIRNTVLYATLQ